jgi:hypothetical protein
MNAEEWYKKKLEEQEKQKEITKQKAKEIFEKLSEKSKKMLCFGIFNSEEFENLNEIIKDKDLVAELIRLAQNTYNVRF